MRIANSQASPEVYWIRNSGGGPISPCFQRSSRPCRCTPIRENHCGTCVRQKCDFRDCVRDVKIAVENTGMKGYHERYKVCTWCTRREGMSVMLIGSNRGEKLADCVSCSWLMIGVRRVLHLIQCKLRGQPNTLGLKLNYFTVIVDVGFTWDQRRILFFFQWIEKTLKQSVYWCAGGYMGIYICENSSYNTLKMGACCCM